jgi:hypothetical protein
MFMSERTNTPENVSRLKKDLTVQKNFPIFVKQIPQV